MKDKLTEKDIIFLGVFSLAFLLSLLFLESSITGYVTGSMYCDDGVCYDYCDTDSDCSHGNICCPEDNFKICKMEDNCKDRSPSTTDMNNNLDFPSDAFQDGQDNMVEESDDITGDNDDVQEYDKGLGSVLFFTGLIFVIVFFGIIYLVNRDSIPKKKQGKQHKDNKKHIKKSKKPKSSR